MSNGGVRVEEGGARWVMWGDIDAAVQVRSEGELLDSLAASPTPVAIDLRDVTFMDSGGLRLLYHAAAGSERPPTLLHTPDRIRDLLEVSGVLPLFTLAS